MSPFRLKKKCRIRVILAWLFAVLTAGCNLVWSAGNDASSQVAPVDAGTSSGWRTIAPGIERRDVEMPTASLLARGKAVLVRIDPGAVTIRVHYSPGAARTLDQWHRSLPNAHVIVNGAFFDESDHALGLIVADGQSYGRTFAGFGGMLQVSADAVRVRSLVSEPYRGEPLSQAVQAFPMLIETGGIIAPQGEGFNERARRTWVGQDRSGRIVFGMTHNLVSLIDLQRWLLDSGLDLDVAFALDGGRSAGMVIDAPGMAEFFPTLDRLPVVIAVYPR